MWKVLGAIIGAGLVFLAGSRYSTTGYYCDRCSKVIDEDQYYTFNKKCIDCVFGQYDD